MTKCIHCGAPREGAACQDRCSRRREDRSGLIDARAMKPTQPGGRAREPFERLSDLMPAIVAAAAANVPAPTAAPAPAPLQLQLQLRGLYVAMGVLTAAVLALMWIVVAGPARATERAARASTKEGVGPGGDERPRPAARKAEGKRSSERSAAKPDTEDLDEARAAAELEERKYSVECLLDKTKCPVTEPPPPPPPVVASEESLLPERLEVADINEGTRAAKAAAVGRCRALARGGEVVKIKLSIAGPSGSVIRATPEDDAGNPRLAACCAEELEAASFKRVRKPQIGAVATIKF